MISQITDYFFWARIPNIVTFMPQLIGRAEFNFPIMK
ncbi:hypothetical protein GO279_04794 [Ralstonia solanacearum]|nr:hypothetical protein GO278_003522 [Ralstonia solanacearum]NKA06547.1 hypothetical protein [Ralstonia solanacearum]NKA10810.1 hypothetical protein [Ralstonia solanacearum]NKA56109.1 hypothetical protein [Ralstonia solanacearum]NKA66641.1 hypothetical protein [Ralstonia solanacearum]